VAPACLTGPGRKPLSQKILDTQSQSFEIGWLLLSMIPGKFSVIVPVFNSRQHLKVCLDSVTAAVEKYGNAELIVLDNGSTDGSYEILQQDYKSAQICSIPGWTIAALRNHGAELSDGEYLSFIDSDCVIPNDYFRQALNLFRSTDADATGSMVALPDMANWIERNWHALHERKKDGYINYLNSGNLVVKRAAFAQVKGFDTSLSTGEDADLGDRLRKVGFKIYECHGVRAIHLGIPRSLGQFVRRQAWYGQAMLGYLHLWKPVTTMLMYPVLVVTGLLIIFFMRGPLAARLGILLLLLNIIPAAAVAYRLRRLGYVTPLLPALLLYHCFYVGRLCGLARALVGSVSRTYRKES
jgi:glycosyltransferase involved in cell wall biosynthesis